MRWALFGGLCTYVIVATVCQENTIGMDVQQELEQQQEESDAQTDTSSEISQVDVIAANDSHTLGVDLSSSQSHGCNGSVCTTVSDFVKPLCEEGRGCNYTLNCFNFSTLGNESFIPSPPSAMNVSPVLLDSILDNKTYANCCVVVMFFVPWCEFSTQFGRKFNAVGRAFNGLPVLAVDLDEPEP